MKVYVSGQEIRLDKSAFVASGGEGEIYAKSKTAYKIYIDPKRMIPEGKIQELSKITDPNVNKPNKIITNSRGKPIGYTTTFIKKAFPLCSMFPRAYRDRNGITPAMTLSLIRRLQVMIDNIHSANILVVDLNEMNFLLNTKHDKIYGIDVDSYQTPHFPATALMDTVRDRHSQKNVFDEGTDWFAFAITSFQMFCGIHPYKGKHSALKGLDARMMANISVLHPDVRVPKAVLPFDIIPQNWKQWYAAVLHDGKRVAPPTGAISTIAIVPRVLAIIGSGNVIITDLNLNVLGNIKQLFHKFGHTVICTDEMIYSNTHPMHKSEQYNYSCAFTSKGNEPIIAWSDNNKLHLRNLTRRYDIAIDADVDSMVPYDGRLLIKSRSHVLEINLTETGGKVIATSKVVGNVMPHATKLYSGVATQNLLGSMFISLFPEKNTCYQVKIPELDSYKIIEAKFDHGVLMVIGVKSHKYDRLVFRFDSKYQTYDLRIVSDITNTGLNFITLDTGICVCLNEEEKIEAFSSRKDSKGLKIVEDKALGGDMVLYRQGGNAVFTRGNKIYQISMR
ncbi:hypothetical protein LCGC14_0469640 [marine sediment metagenome]|uniref:Protein kinase domain-containing protein n=1 Tax=marine sediment metagenome TaxID=412755 RepID=A0A0F9SHU0_9ZZZZ